MDPTVKKLRQYMEAQLTSLNKKKTYSREEARIYIAEKRIYTNLIRILQDED